MPSPGQPGRGSASSPTSAPGCPYGPAAGDAARAVIPDARIAYIDHDPIVAMHAEVLLADDEGTAVADADLADPAAVLAHPDVRAVIDPAEPVCIILGLVLGLMPARQAREVVAGYADLIAPGSYVVISCGRCDDEVLRKELGEAYTAGRHRTTTRRPRSRGSSPAWSSSRRASSRRRTGGAAGTTCPRRHRVRRTCWPGSRGSSGRAMTHCVITSR